MFGVPGEFTVVIDATNGIGRIVKLAFLLSFGTWAVFIAVNGVILLCMNSSLSRSFSLF